MPRIARVVVPNIPYHITQRGNFKQDVFYDDKDRGKYLSLVKENIIKLNIELLAYCLMSNHVHFVLVPQQSDSLGVMFNQVSMRYAQYINRKLNRRGHLWQDRYFSCPLDKDHLYEVFKYVENNPVKAGIVGTAEEYPWSSARAHIFNNLPEDSFLTDYSKYLKNIDNWNDYLKETSNETILSNLKKCTSSGKPAGSEEFVKELEFKVGRILRSKPMGRPWPKKGKEVVFNVK